jgi:hypothetical protein
MLIGTGVVIGSESDRGGGNLERERERERERIEPLVVSSEYSDTEEAPIEVADRGVVISERGIRDRHRDEHVSGMQGVIARQAHQLRCQQELIESYERLSRKTLRVLQGLGPTVAELVQAVDRPSGGGGEESAATFDVLTRIDERAERIHRTEVALKGLEIGGIAKQYLYRQMTQPSEEPDSQGRGVWRRMWQTDGTITRSAESLGKGDKTALLAESSNWTDGAGDRTTMSYACYAGKSSGQAELSLFCGETPLEGQTAVKWCCLQYVGDESSVAVPGRTGEFSELFARARAHLGTNGLEWYILSRTGVGSDPTALHTADPVVAPDGQYEYYMIWGESVLVPTE